jgi:hypothetical protein
MRYYAFFKYVARMREGGGCNTGLWWGNLREGDHLEDLVLDARIILQWILQEYNGRAWAGFIWLRVGLW